MKVYFIPGLGALCNCFKYIELPLGYEKVYLEWHIPQGSESILEYSKKMAEAIDTTEPFILVGYSFGGVVIQEMNKFLNPQKNILIASMANKKQIPSFFKILKALRFSRWFPMRFFIARTGFSYNFLRTLYYKTKEKQFQDNRSLKDKLRLEEYIMEPNPIYLKWAIDRILNWIPTEECTRLYQIHGTRDIIFPFGKIKGNTTEKLQVILEASHLLVLEYPKKINRSLKEILLK